MPKHISASPKPRQIKQRIMSSETEFGYWCREDITDWNFLISETDCCVRRTMKPKGNFLINQGCVESDAGLHPEYSAPECLGSRQAALYDTAGLNIMARAIRKWRRSLSEQGLRAPNLALYKNNRDTALNNQQENLSRV
jgi:hypothetical protein